MPEIIDFGRISKPERKVLEITSFAGIDLSSAPSDVDKKRSPEAVNMMPDSLGNPIKRTGFGLMGDYGERINGFYKLGEHRIIHAGTKLYMDGNLIREGLNDAVSSAQALGGKLWLFDGKEAVAVSDGGAMAISEEAYIPTVLISKNADLAERKTVLKGDGATAEFEIEREIKEIISVLVDSVSTEASLSGGKIIFDSAPEENAKIEVTFVAVQEPGGSIKEEFNLISPRWKESFLCDTGTEKIFSLSKTGLSDGAIKAFIMDENGNWQEKTEGTDFSADRENGKITFNEPVPKTPVIGTDNLVIEAEKDFDGYPDRVNLCRQSICFDTGGTSGRIFISGNPNEPGTDRWCAAGDPTYWPDIYYSVIGSDGAKIVGYSVIEDVLATYISGSRDGRSIVIREPELGEDGNVSFPIVRHLQGEEAVAPKGFVFMEKEQLFLTARGVYAITTEDISGEKYTQNRSFFINKALCTEELENAFCAKWKQFYIISTGEKLYLLDTSQQSFGKGEPLSTWQYECYLWTGIDARVLWEEEGTLFFGDSKGRVCYFKKDGYSDYSEEGEKAIVALWTFPDFMGDYFFRNKTIRMVAVQAAPYPQNKIKLEYRIGGVWKKLAEWAGKISYFTWEKLRWSDFSWSGDTTPRTVTLKTKIKKFDKCGFRIICDEMEKAFGLYGFAVEYTENGRYKK